MHQRFPRPDRYFARCGRLDAIITVHHIDSAPPFMGGLRAVFVTDVHVLPDTTNAQLSALMDLIASASPDLLLLGGDYSDRVEDCARFFEALGSLSIPLGAFGVLGNNDAEAWSGQLKQLRRFMAKGRCTLLINSTVKLRCNGGTICVGGIDEYRYGKPDCSHLWTKNASPDCYRILLSHYPVMTTARPDLMLSGHTHGGQFNLLGLTPYAIGFEQFGKPKRASVAVSGLHDLGGMKLLVSKGIGASRLQLRIGVKPEINLLEFDQRGAAPAFSKR